MPEFIDKTSDYSEIFKSAVRNISWFPMVYDLARINSMGRLWIIGGFVYRTIIKELYGNELPKIDIDIISENRPEEGIINLPEGWEKRISRYGNLGIMMGDLSIDFNYLFSWHSIIRRGLEPTIDNFETGTPLNIQSIAYSFEDKEVIGWRGIRAIREKIIEVNNPQEAIYEADRRKISLEELISRKANEFGFKYVLPGEPKSPNLSDRASA